MAVVAVSAYPYPYPQGPGGALAIPRPGPDGSYAKDHYFQYTNVPAEKVTLCTVLFFVLLETRGLRSRARFK